MQVEVPTAVNIETTHAVCRLYKFSDLLKIECRRCEYLMARVGCMSF